MSRRSIERREISPDWVRYLRRIGAVRISSPAARPFGPRGRQWEGRSLANRAGAGWHRENWSAVSAEPARLIDQAVVVSDDVARNRGGISALALRVLRLRAVVERAITRDYNVS